MTLSFPGISSPFLSFSYLSVLSLMISCRSCSVIRSCSSKILARLVSNSACRASLRAKLGDGREKRSLDCKVL